MKKILMLLLFLVAFCSYSRVKYDSFENGIPAHWSLVGRGKLSLSKEHARHGKQSLQWKWCGGDVLTIENLSGILSAFKPDSAFSVSVYSENAIRQSLRFEFMTGNKASASFSFPLNFTGWQPAYVHYSRSKTLHGQFPARLDAICIKAPADGSGCLFIDLVIYNQQLSRYFDGVPLAEPWMPSKVDEKQYPLPRNVSPADQAALKKIRQICLPQMKSGQLPNAVYEKLVVAIKSWNVSETAGKIYGKGIQIPTHKGSTAAKFFLDAGLKKDSLSSYRDILYDVLMPISKYYALGVSKDQHREIAGYLIPLFRHMLDQGLNTSCVKAMDYPYFKNPLALAVYHHLDCFNDKKLLKDIGGFLQYDNLDLFSAPYKYPSMDYFYSYDTIFMLASINSPDQETLVQTLRYLSWKLSAEICYNYARNGFRPDGSGFHHEMHYLAYAMKGATTVCAFAEAAAGSSFALKPEALKILRKFALNLFFCSMKMELPLGLHGRQVFYYKNAWCLPLVLKNLALANPDGVDRELAGMFLYVLPRLNKSYFDDNIRDAKKSFEAMGIKPLKPRSGSLVMPYAGLVALRGNDDKWLAVSRCYGKYIKGSEIYPKNNRYGRYIGSATLDILNNDFEKSGTVEDGWDWNRINGATVIYYPLKELAAGMPSEYLHTPYGFFGGLSWRGKNAIMTMKISGNGYEPSFSGLKSYFFVDDHIIALGSDIKCKDKSHPVQTNLFQKHLINKADPVWIDGKKITEFPVEAKLDPAKSHSLIDPMGNAYIIGSGQNVCYTRKTQNSRDNKDLRDTSGDFAAAWIDHGIAPENAAYSYAVYPQADAEKAAAWLKKGIYKIIRRDARAHIVHDVKSDIYAAVFFKAGKIENIAPVKNVSRPCLAMFKKDKEGKLLLTVADPDTNRRFIRKRHVDVYGESIAKPLEVTLDGNWALSDAVDGVTLQNKGEECVIKFQCVDGKSFDLHLKSNK